MYTYIHMYVHLCMVHDTLNDMVFVNTYILFNFVTTHTLMHWSNAVQTMSPSCKEFYRILHSSVTFVPCQGSSQQS